MGSGLLLATAARPENLSIFDPASPPAGFIRDLFVLVLVIVGAIFLLYEGVLVYSIFRFRRDAAATTPETEPPQVYGSRPIEIAWTVAPAVIVFILMLLLIRTEFEVRVDQASPPRDSKPVYVMVVGHQWWWEYRYYEKHYKHYDPPYKSFDEVPPLFITANELRVPVTKKGSKGGDVRPVYLTLKSADVCHSYWVPRLAGKMDLIPGRTNELWLEPREARLFLGQCAEYCGTQHAKMLLRVIAEDSAKFEEWLANEKKPAVEDPKVRAGRDTFLSVACVNCHTVRGTSARGTFGPDLTHLMSRATLATGIAPNNRTKLREWVVDPQQMKPGCLMPAMKLPEKQVDLVVDYLLSLK